MRERSPPLARLRAEAGLCEAALFHGGLACLCGMRAAAVLTPPIAVQAEVARFFADQEAWLQRVLTYDRASGVRIPRIARH